MNDSGRAKQCARSSYGRFMICAMMCLVMALPSIMIAYAMLAKCGPGGLCALIAGNITVGMSYLAGSQAKAYWRIYSGS
jgi:ABC-type Fe3+ transport system permease subunit